MKIQTFLLLAGLFSFPQANAADTLTGTAELYPSTSGQSMRLFLTGKAAVELYYKVEFNHEMYCEMTAREQYSCELFISRSGDSKNAADNGETYERRALKTAAFFVTPSQADADLWEITLRGDLAITLSGWMKDLNLGNPKTDVSCDQRSQKCGFVVDHLGVLEPIRW